jgi:putative endonuclease
MDKYMYVYILKCSDNSYDTGVTNNIERRVAEHNSGLNTACYTYARRPLKLVYSEKFQTAIEAISMEKKLKGWSRKKK